MGLIAPGICVQFEPAGAFEKPLCGQSKGIGKAPPRWFAATVQMLLGDHASVERPISARAATAGTVRATSDPDAAIALAWQHILDNIHVALLMALAIALLASLAIAHTLAPAHSIVSALRRMADGAVPHAIAAHPLDGARDDRPRRRRPRRPPRAAPRRNAPC